MPFGSLGDIPAATAILDRFLAHATIVQMTGKSYRNKELTGTLRFQDRSGRSYPSKNIPVNFRELNGD